MHFVHKICPISCTNSRNLLHEFKKILHIYYYFRARKTHKNFVHRAILYPTNSCIIVHNRPFLVHEINKSCIRALNNPNKIYARKKIYARIRETTSTSVTGRSHSRTIPEVCQGKLVPSLTDPNGPYRIILKALDPAKKTVRH